MVFAAAVQFLKVLRVAVAVVTKIAPNIRASTAPAHLRATLRAQVRLRAILQAQVRLRAVHLQAPAHLRAILPAQVRLRAILPAQVLRAALLHRARLPAALHQAQARLRAQARVAMNARLANILAFTKVRNGAVV